MPLPTSSVTLEGDYNYQPDPSYTDPMGATIPGDTSYDPLEVQKMKAALEGRKQMSIAEMGSNLYNNAKNVAAPIQKLIDQTGITAPSQTAAALATSFPSFLLHGFGSTSTDPETRQKLLELSQQVQYQPSSPMAQQALGMMSDVQKELMIPPYTPGIGLRAGDARTFTPADLQVLGARGINTARELKAVPQDFNVGRQGFSVLNSIGEPTIGSKLGTFENKVIGEPQRQKLRKAASNVPEDVSYNALRQRVNESYEPGMPMFIMQGEKSNLWNADFSSFAKQLEKEKYEPDVIHSLTGTYRGLDQKWRQEIPDIGAQMKIDSSLADRSDLKIRDIIDHPKLFDAYPHLGDINVHMWDIPGATGRYNEMLNRIDLHNALLNNPKEAKKTLLHELQHAIQHYEGFEKGSNTSMHPPSHIMEDAYELEQLMNKNNISALDAAKLFEKEKGRPPHGDQYDNAVNIANHGQASLIPFIEPTDRYYHTAGEMEADLPGVRMDLPEDQLSKHFPLKQGQHGLNLNPENALVQKGVDKLGNPIYVTSKQLKEQTQRNLNKPTAAQMKAEIKKRQDDKGWNYSIKNPGGNWVDAQLNYALKPYKQGLTLAHDSDPYTLRPGWEEMADRIGYSPEQQQRMLATQSLNQWVDKRLKKYIKNDMGTPEDPVRDLADQGITHIQGLGERWREPLNQTGKKQLEVLGDLREEQGHPREGYATTPEGKDWETKTDWGLDTVKIKDALHRLHPDEHPSVEEWKGLQKALEKDPEAETNRYQTLSNFGFDHLTDELRNAVDSTTDLPQHLRLSTKDLERMTVPDAVRHVAKTNKYRADLAEKATVKNLGEFRQNFPALKTYDNGMAWHELKEPDMHDNQAKNREILDKALKEEGDLMGHCVGGYTDDVVNGSSRIFTLRDAKGKPHVTIETQPTTGLEESDLPFSDHHDVAQIKGKGNKEVSPKYHAEVIDFLNNVKPHVKLHDVNDLWNINAIDISRMKNMAGGKEIDANIRAAVPNLPRFISRELWDQLVNQHYIKKPIQGHKRGGHIKSLEHDRMKFELMMRGKHG